MGPQAGHVLTRQSRRGAPAGPKGVGKRKGDTSAAKKRKIIIKKLVERSSTGEITAVKAVIKRVVKVETKIISKPVVAAKNVTKSTELTSLPKKDISSEKKSLKKSAQLKTQLTTSKKAVKKVSEKTLMKTIPGINTIKKVKSVLVKRGTQLKSKTVNTDQKNALTKINKSEKDKKSSIAKPVNCSTKFVHPDTLSTKDTMAVGKSVNSKKPNEPSESSQSKNRSRSPEKKKRAGVLRSSSAPLMPTSGSDSSTDDDPKTTGTQRLSKLSSEDVSSSLSMKTNVSKKAKVDVTKAVQPVTQKPIKETTVKSVSDKFSLKTDVSDMKIKPSNFVENLKKSDESKDVGIPLKTSFLDSRLVSPLGRKKLVGKVKPIARVKGTIIEKAKVETEKRKLATSPSKSIDEKVATDKDLTTADKNKVDLEKKKNVCPPKQCDETKKITVEKDVLKIPKTTKKTEDEKISSTAGNSKNVMIVQPDVSAAVILTATSKDSEVAKLASKTKNIVTLKTKKKFSVNRAKLISKGPKKLLSSGRNADKKNLLQVNKQFNKTTTKSADPINVEIDETEIVTYSFPKDNNSDTVEKVKKAKSKISVEGKSEILKQTKISKIIPKKPKLDEKEPMFDELSKKLLIIKDELDESNNASTKSSSVINVDENVVQKLQKQNKSKTSSPVRDKLCKGKTNVDSPNTSKTTKEPEDSIKKTNLDEVPRESVDELKIDSDEEIKFSFPTVTMDEKKRNSSPSDKRTNLPSTSNKPMKKNITIPTDESKRRKKLLGFWTGPKRHREASLNALAKVQCMYENESRTHLELGLMRTVDRGPPKWKDAVKKKHIKTEKRDSASSESEYERKIKLEMTSSEDESSPPVARTLRCQPGSRGAGKYWEMKISSSEDSEAEHKRIYVEKKKIVPKPKVHVKTEPKSDVVKPPKEPNAVKKRRNRTEVVMDLRDMVVKKRMASLNATAILAASYEKRSPKSNRDETTSSDCSSEQDDSFSKKYKPPVGSDRGEISAKKELALKAIEAKAAAKAKLVVNQEADVTITGVYSTHREGYCTVTGMQYFISATSHTQTTATAAAEKEIPVGTAGPSYTPLGALSSMHPPGGVAPPHTHPGPVESRGPMGGGSLGRRAGCSSAFSAPPHHHADQDRSPPGYYQPAGPLISAGPLHGGFKDSGVAPGPTPQEQSTHFGRYQYPQQPQQVMHYTSGFGAPHAHAHPHPAHLQYGVATGGQYVGGVVAGTGVGESCYAGGGSRTAPQQPCYRPPPAHRPPNSYRPPPPPDNQVSPSGADAYAPQYCAPCYQHPHLPAPPRPPIGYIDPAYQQGCPCPQAFPKNVLTGPATGNPPAGGGPSNCSPPGGGRASLPAVPTFADDKRKAKIPHVTHKDPPLLNRVLKNECNAKNNGPELRSGACQATDGGRSPKREYFPEASGRGRQEAVEGRSGCCAVAVNPSLSVMPRLPEPVGPPSPARGSAGASVPQPPDPPQANCQPPQRRARLGKAMARKSIGAEDAAGHTTLLICQPRSLPADVGTPDSMAPLRIETESASGKDLSDEVKSEVDSGDDVILIDSPDSKLAPIDLSSSEENCTDSKSEKDCTITRMESPVIVDLIVHPKKENSVFPSETPIRKHCPPLSDPPALKEQNTDRSTVSDESLKKSSDNKCKIGTKRRCSQPKLEIDLDLDIDDNLAANGIGEHVKLQKRQKVSLSNQHHKKSPTTGSYKDLIKKNDKVFKLNNGKRQLNTIKSKPAKGMTLIESDKSQLKKAGNKRKSSSPTLPDAPVNKRKKFTTSLLKSADKKQISRLCEDDAIVEKLQDSCKKSVLSPIPKNKSAILLDKLMLKNNIDRVIESVVKNNADGDIDPSSVRTPTKSSSICVPKSTKKCSSASGTSSETGAIKSRTVLNINNNVVKKVIEANISNAAPTKRKLSTDKQTRTKSKSPAAKKLEKAQVKEAVKVKIPPVTESKDSRVKLIKSENLKLKKTGKSQTGVNTKGGAAKRKSKSTEIIEPPPLIDTCVALSTRRSLSSPRWSNGWTWEGEPQQGKVFINNEDTWFYGRCYPGMRHDSAGDAVRRGDCVLLRAGTRRNEAPYVARVAQLWENPNDGEMMVSLLWYYRPEHTEIGRQAGDSKDEVFASRHRDANSVACIEDKCYVLTFNEYCRYRKECKIAEEKINCPPSVVPSMPPSEMTSATITNDGKIPPNTSPESILFCRRVYDYRKKTMKAPAP